LIVRRVERADGPRHRLYRRRRKSIRFRSNNQNKTVRKCRSRRPNCRPSHRQADEKSDRRRLSRQKAASRRLRRIGEASTTSGDGRKTKPDRPWPRRDRLSPKRPSLPVVRRLLQSERRDPPTKLARKGSVCPRPNADAVSSGLPRPADAAAWRFRVSRIRSKIAALNPARACPRLPSQATMVVLALVLFLLDRRII
jgi:hypothetical protein